MGDPNLWTEILRANDLASITDVRPGMELVIPATQVAAANRALRQALQAIRRATEEGARLFAAEQIEASLRLYEEGVARRKAGDWDTAASLAGDATTAALAALETATAQRDAAAEARLSDRTGSVEGRRPQDLAWSDRPLGAMLIEEEKVRTLSLSSAQITFRDDSRLRLSANSQAVIQRMRVDPLGRKEEAKVSLVEGDFYALLSGRSERRSFELEVPEARTDIESRNFWVRRDASGAKFTNYDDRTLDVAANGAAVTLGRNEGTLVRTGQAPSGKIGVLSATRLTAPADDGETPSPDVELSWAPLADADGYWLELAVDPAFQRLAASRWGLKDEHFWTDPLPVGTYYWRVAGLDKFGLPGERSTVWRFHVRVDRTPPFLSIGEPAEGAILRSDAIRVEGEIEPGARLSLNGTVVEVGADGRFATSATATRLGENVLTLVATDAAGNLTERTRSFRYEPDARAILRFDDAIPRLGPGRFVTGGDVISLAGATDVGTRLLVRAADGAVRATTHADDTGRFALNLPLAAAEEAFTVEVVQPSGFSSREQFAVVQKRDPPAITLEEPPPAVTAVERLPLRGRAEGARSLTMNGRPARLIGYAFDEAVTLHQGENTLELVATDIVGNVRVERFEVGLDQNPPELVGYRVTPFQARAGEPVWIEVTARDASGLRKAAPFRLRVGDKEIADFLELGTGGAYHASLPLPAGAAGRVRLLEVEVEDYVGNKARFTPDK
ncbi:FecR domain-containing protein [Benzoatithermus flavus]|uniref:FecR domain-containing protein n=1 Tax=Benzoatithermus flavus TaxID=3108223 RepID=A0ABU8XXU1_9PROT